MRPRREPRIEWRKPRPDKSQAGVWVIRDGRKEISTGEGKEQRSEADLALAAYITKNREPEFGDGHPNEVLIGDCLSFYADEKGSATRPVALAKEIERLSEFWGDKYVDEVTPKLCKDYVKWRCAQRNRCAKNGNGKPIAASTAKRELVTLIAACNFCYENKKLDRPPRGFELPQVVERRERFLERGELARLLAGALGWDSRTGKRNKFRINRHLARFILVGYYTGTRHDAILSLGWMRSVNGGWFDLNSGVLYRRPQDAIETNKTRKPCPIPDELMRHLRRWKRLTTRYAIERDGKPIESQLRRSWKGARILAGLDADVTPHILKHTCATHWLQNGRSTWDLAGFLGTSEATIRKTYGHHAQKHIRTVLKGAFKRAKNGS
jgi:integrase